MHNYTCVAQPTVALQYTEGTQFIMLWSFELCSSCRPDHLHLHVILSRLHHL